MAVDWEWYVRRVRLDVEKWLVQKGAHDYETFVSILQKENLIPPPAEKVKHYFDSLFPSEEKVKAENAKKKWGIVEEKPSKKKKKMPSTQKKSVETSEPVQDSLYHDG